MNKLKQYIKYTLRRLGNPSKEIKKLLSAEQYLSFDDRSRVFSITDEKLTIHELKDIRRTLMRVLRGIRPLTSVKIDDLITGYYDKCLERYLYERLNRHKSNRETCWFKDAQNNKCIGRVDTDATFGSAEKKQLLYSAFKHKPNIKTDVDKLAESIERDSNGFVYKRSNNIYDEDSKIIPLYKGIKRDGFNNLESSLIPIILGYSKKTGRFNVISGRHRIAVLRFLRSQGLIRKNIGIKCHLVKYPFESLVYTRPFASHCQQCDWGGIFDPGAGTHQDFYVREGIATLRGDRNKKGGRQKWNRIQPVFRQMVSNKRVLDVGAHRGMYCLKALEYGASHVAALEPNEALADIIHTVMENYVLDDLEIIIGDFFNDEDYDSLIKNRYDTVFLFGIIHHLLRMGIQRGILYSFDELFQRISKIAGYGVLVEFSLPRESSLNLPEIEPYRQAFSQKVFEKALVKNFPTFKNLGRCNYRSGNKYGRFMYYAKKQ